MKLVSVIRSYVGRKLTFGPIEIRPFYFTEVDHKVVQTLDADVKHALRLAIGAKEVSIALMADDKPVDQQNEKLVLQMKEQSDKTGE